MRNAFVAELIALAAADPAIVLVVGDLGFAVVEPFAERFPGRFINAGVAEQNMMGLAAGMASEGLRPYVYSIANFPLFRCAEQLRNDVAYHRLPVTVVSVGGGLAYGNLGYSHHAIQDYALVRTMPNMAIAAPGDPMEVRACMRWLHANPRPAYLRLGKAGEPCVHASVPSLEPGLWQQLVEPKGEAKRCFLTTGAALAIAQSWLQLPRYAGWGLCSLPLWGMHSKDGQARQVQAWDEVVTVEDHLADAGFGSWLREALADAPRLMARVRSKALAAEVSGMVGAQATLNALGGLVAE